MSFQIEFSPESQLAFTYLPNEHLTTVLKITNKNEFPIVFKVIHHIIKFKASTVNKFIIRPNQSCLKAGQSQEVKIILHKDVIV
jgi:P pilus assembly chaperone PapD